MSFKPENYKNYFNWTMTYRQDSTISIPYGWIEKIKNHPSGEQLEKMINIFGEKHKHFADKGGDKVKIAWMVSNCLSESNREGFVEALKKHMDVDIFGSCYKNSKKCDKSNFETCWNKISQEYHFYLAFENSLCKDYVTEKFWEPLKRNIVPVVLGGGNYSKIAPYRSYVDVIDMGLDEDPASLAKILTDLVKNKSKYASYFWWKKYYNVRNSPQDRASDHCKVCQLLHEIDKKVRNSILFFIKEINIDVCFS